MPLRFALAATGCVVHLTTGNNAPPPSLTPAAYQHAVLSAAGQIDAAAGRARTQPRSPTRIPAIRLPAPPGADRRGFPADLWLQASLCTITGQTNRRLQARSLATLAASVRRLGAPGPAVAEPRSAPKDAVALILAQKPYRDAIGAGPAPPPSRSLLERLLDWLGRMLGKVLGVVFRGASSVPLFGELLAVIFLLALLAAAVYITIGVVRCVRIRRAPQYRDLGLPLPQPIDADELYRRGLAHAGRGEYGAAIAALFQSSLACLDGGGAIAYDASRTAGEYRRLVMRVLRPASSHFDALALIFSFIAYAERTPSEQDWVDARSAFLALRPLIA